MDKKTEQQRLSRVVSELVAELAAKAFRLSLLLLTISSKVSGGHRSADNDRPEFFETKGTQ